MGCYAIALVKASVHACRVPISETFFRGQQLDAAGIDVVEYRVASKEQQPAQDDVRIAELANFGSTFLPREQQRGACTFQQIGALETLHVQFNECNQRNVISCYQTMRDYSVLSFSGSRILAISFD